MAAGSETLLACMSSSDVHSFHLSLAIPDSLLLSPHPCNTAIVLNINHFSLGMPISEVYNVSEMSEMSECIVVMSLKLKK